MWGRTKGLAMIRRSLAWSESLEQEQESRVNMREKRRTSRSSGAYRSIVNV